MRQTNCIIIIKKSRKIRETKEGNKNSNELYFVLVKLYTKVPIHEKEDEYGK